MDGLDETRVGSGEENFLAFLEGIQRYWGDDQPRPTLLLLGRKEASEWTELWLDRTPFASYQIDYFDDSAADVFVERYVSARWKDKDRTTSPGEPVWRARDQILGLLRKAVTTRSGSNRIQTERLVRSVVGYAPVLEAVGEFLVAEDVKNYQKLIATLEKKTENYEWVVLTHVAESLLEREQGKFRQQKEEDLRKGTSGSSASGWPDVFSPDEQRIRLLHKKYQVPLAPPLPPLGLPTSVREQYERAIDEQLGTHPFKDHLLFEEYLVAWSFTTERIVPAAARAMEARLTAASHRPTPALGHFLLSLRALDGVARIDGPRFGFFYESLRAEEASIGDIHPDLFSTGKGAVVSGRITKEGSSPLRFEVTSTDKRIWFWGRLSHANISVFDSIELGVEGAEFRLGPDVFLECSTLNSPASNLHIFAVEGTEGEKGKHSVVLAADTFPDRMRPLSVRGDRFFVRGASLRWPWNEYEDKEPSAPTKTPQIIAAYNDLARILLWFQAQGHEEIARIDDLVEKAATGSTARARELLSFCLSKGLVTKSGRMYELNQPRLREFGINYDDLNRRVLRDPVVGLLSEFVQR